MADSKRQKIINAVDARLKTILVTGGFETDLGKNVFAWRSEPLQASELPGLIYRDVSQEVSDDEAAIGQHEYELTVEVEIIAQSGATTGSQLRKMIADVIKAIGVDITWGALAQRSNPVSDSINFEQAEKVIAGALVTFTIIYRTNQWDAYT